MGATIELKGIREGLLATLPVDTSWEETLALLRAHLDRQGQFFKGAHLAIDVGARPLKVNDLVALRDLLSERDILLWAVISESPLTEKTAHLLGLATRLGKPRSTPWTKESQESALWIERTVRSGVKIEHLGPVIIIGDVNPGAEIVTASSLLVWGRLRGAVSVGQPDNAQAFICALRFQTTQASIAGTRLPPPPTTDHPLKASLQNQLPHWEKWE